MARPLKRTLELADIEIWNDSCSVEELNYAIGQGATGATTNPPIVLNVLKQEMSLWEDWIHRAIKDNPSFSEVELGWKLIEAMAQRAAGILKPIFDRAKGRKGCVSIQTNAQLYRDAQAMTQQAVHFNGLAPNIMVKIPTTAAGILALEEATYQGVSINATVCFSVPQSLAVAEAVERGLKRREAEGKDCSPMTPVCTIMVGRLDDWLKIVAEKARIITHPGVLDWAGVAAFKRAYEIYQERGYRIRLLSAAYRNHYHWSQLIGDEVVQTIPYGWQKRFNESDIVPERSLHKPVDPAIMKELQGKFPDFNRAYEPQGMKVEEFDSFGATARTLRTFLEGYAQFLELVRGKMIPNPDL